MGLPSYRRDTKALRADKDQMQRSVLMKEGWLGLRM